MGFAEINQRRLKVFIQLTHENEEIGRMLPEAEKISEREIFFKRDLSPEERKSIEKVTLFIRHIGIWKEYAVRPVNEVNQGQSFNLLTFMVEERDQASFKQDFMQIQN